MYGISIYWAAPLFTIAERDFNAKCVRALRIMWYEVFLPQESEQQQITPRAIFDSDRAGIDHSDIVVACMDGPDPDSGTCWETGYAYGIKKPYIVFRTD